MAARGWAGRARLGLARPGDARLAGKVCLVPARSERHGRFMGLGTPFF